MRICMSTNCVKIQSTDANYSHQLPASWRRSSLQPFRFELVGYTRRLQEIGFDHRFVDETQVLNQIQPIDPTFNVH